MPSLVNSSNKGINENVRQALYDSYRKWTTVPVTQTKVRFICSNGASRASLTRKCSATVKRKGERRQNVQLHHSTCWMCIQKNEKESHNRSGAAQSEETAHLYACVLYTNRFLTSELLQNSYFREVGDNVFVVHARIVVETNLHACIQMTIAQWLWEAPCFLVACCCK